MKPTLASLVLFLLLSKFGSAQYEPANYAKVEKPLHATYLGLGTGFNGKYGLLGIDFGMRLNDKTLAEANLGFGLWGPKMGVSFTTFAGKHNTWCPSIGFTRNYGLNQYPYKPEVLHNYRPGDPFVLKETTLNLKAINVLHLSIQKQFLNHKGNRFFVEMGISIPLNEMQVEFNEVVVYEESGNPNTYWLTQDLRFSQSQIDKFKQQSPSGINVSVGYQFGMGKFN